MLRSEIKWYNLVKIEVRNTSRERLMRKHESNSS